MLSEKQPYVIFFVLVLSEKKLTMLHIQHCLAQLSFLCLINFKIELLTEFPFAHDENYLY